MQRSSSDNSARGLKKNLWIFYVGSLCAQRLDFRHRIRGSSKSREGKSPGGTALYGWKMRTKKNMRLTFT